MKFIVILIILFYQYHHVRSDRVLEFMSSKITEFFTSIANAIRTARDKVKSIFFTRPKKPIQTSSTPWSTLKHKNRKAFTKYIQTTPHIEVTKVTAFLDPRSNSVTTQQPVLQRIPQEQIESHAVNTQDGYILIVHRVLKEDVIKLTNNTVLLHHGLLGSSTDWLLLGPEKSLPFLLSNAGYDVWMTNARGNYYSRNHAFIDVKSEQFWNFTWQEMGQHDLPAVIDYIRNKKKSNESINFIGHSMGATALLVLLSTSPIYNSYLKIGVLLAPLAFMADVKGPIKQLATGALSPSEQLLSVMGPNSEIFPSRVVPKWLASKFCEGPEIFCRNPLLFFSGDIPHLKNAEINFISKFMNHFPSGGSSNTILHYAQLAKTGKFHKYNDRYSEFSLKNVTLPIALFSSSADWLATLPDVVRLYDSIANPIDHTIVCCKNISHTEFLWGSQAEALIFTRVLDLLENGLKMD